MRFYITLLILLCVAPNATAQHASVGINLEGNTYYSHEYVFTDLSNSVNTSFAQKNGAGWAQSDPGGVVYGADGYPTYIANDHSARTLWDTPKGHAGGQHVLLWDGTGDIDMILTPGNTIVSDVAGRIVFDLPVASTVQNRRGFEIKSTDLNDPVRNVRIVPIAEEAAYTGSTPSNPFRSVFTNRWSNMSAFRYMDWTKTNNSTLSNWADRPHVGDFTQGGEYGVAIEHQINHANTTQSQPWFNIPHLATDNFVENMATLIRDNLDAGLTARIEFSNEVWNSSFSQTQHAISQGPSIGESADGLGGLRWYSHRSVEIFDIFEDVFTNGGANPAGMDRLVRVMASQAANDWVAQQILEYNDAYLKTDALAIAPYFGGGVQAGAEADLWTNATWPQRIAMVDQDLQTAMNNMDDHANLLNNTTDGQGANIYSNIKLFAYEGGQHYLGFPNTHGNVALTELMQELSRRPEMQQWYFDYLTHWDQIGGEDFMIFASMGEQTQWGSWGITQHEGQPLSETPKLQGILDYLASVTTPGDFDGDGQVSGADFLLWQRGGVSTPPDANDLAEWVAAYGGGTSMLASASVPEPASLLLFLLGSSLIISARCF